MRFMIQSKEYLIKMTIRKKMTTQEAFEWLINEHYFNMPLCEKKKIASVKSRYLKGQVVTNEKMEQLLTDYGFTIVQKKLWKRKK